MQELTHEVLNDPSAHYIVKDTIVKFLNKDIVDAVRDAEIILKVLENECNYKLGVL